MDLERLIPGLASLVLAMNVSATQLEEMDEERLFKNYALTMCIATEYPDSDVYNDSIKALNGYREFGNIHLDAYFELTGALNGWQAEEYSSKSGEVVEIARCIDFHNSSQVAAIFEKYVSE